VVSITHLANGNPPTITFGQPFNITKGGVGGGGGCAIPAEITPVHTTTSVIRAAGINSIKTFG